MAPGTITKLTAIGTYSNSSSAIITTAVTWNSSNTGIAIVSNASGSQGFVTAATATTGTTTITATLGGIMGSTILTTASVTSISVTPAAPSSIAPGTTLQYTATGTLSDTNSTRQNLTTFATWTSADPTIALVGDITGSKGLATAVSPGVATTATTTITATFEGIPGMASFQTSSLDSISTSPPSATIPKGTTQQFAATGNLANGIPQTLTAFATWTSSNTGVATISNTAGSKGLATAVNVGTTFIFASFSNITSSPLSILTVTAPILSSITVTPVNPSIALGLAEQFTALGTFSDGSIQNVSSQVTWNSSDQTVASISSTGVATAVKTGLTKITATSGGISGSTTLTVTQVVLQSIEVTPTPAFIVLSSGLISKTFTATGHFSDGSTQNLTTVVTWSSSLIGVATISNAPGLQGVATGMSPGTTDITATLSGLTSNTATLVVSF